MRTKKKLILLFSLLLVISVTVPLVVSAMSRDEVMYSHEAISLDEVTRNRVHENIREALQNTGEHEVTIRLKEIPVGSEPVWMVGRPDDVIDFDDILEAFRYNNREFASFPTVISDETSVLSLDDMDIGSSITFTGVTAEVVAMLIPTDGDPIVFRCYEEFKAHAIAYEANLNLISPSSFHSPTCQGWKSSRSHFSARLITVRTYPNGTRIGSCNGYRYTGEDFCTRCHHVFERFTFYRSSCGATWLE